MSDESEPTQRRRLPKIASYGLLTLGGIAVLAPVILLYRTNPNRIAFNKRLRTNAPPPVRRSHGAAVIAKDDSSLKLSDISFSPRRLLATHDHDEDEVVPPAGQGPGPLHAFKAFGIATCIVGVTAIASILAVRSFLGVESPEQFAQLMTSKLAILVPSLISRIHRNPSDKDFSPISPLDRQGQPATLDGLGSLETNSLDWMKDLEDQLEREAAAEREERQARRRK